MSKTISLRSQLLKSFMGVGAVYALAIPITFLISVILARTLGAESFGQYAFIMSLLPLLALPAAGGLPQLLTRQVASYVHAGQWSLYRGAVKAAHIWVVSIAIMLMAIYFVVGPLAGLLPREGKWSLIGLVILLVPLQGLNAVRNGTIKGLGFPAQAEMPTKMIQPVLLLFVVLALAATGMLSARNALWAQVGVAAVTFIMASLLFLRHRPKAAQHAKLEYQYKPWLIALLPFTLISLVGTFNAQISIVLLGILGTDEAVASLRVADRGAQFVALSLVLVKMVISPHIVKAYKEDDKDKLQKLSLQSSRGAFAIALPISVVLVIFGKQLINLAFGAEYVELAYLPMVILVIGNLISVTVGPVGLLLSMSGYEKLTLTSYLVALVATVVAAWFLIPVYLEVGAAIAVVIGVVVVNSFAVISVIKILKIRPGVL